MPRARAVPFLALLGLASMATAPARAQSSSDQAAAEALFKQGRDLMAAGRYPEACGKLAESERLDPAAGTVLNLATCYEKNGQVASAWVTFKDAARIAQRAGQTERAQLARQKADELEPKLPTLVIVVPAAAERPDLQVKRDGEVVGRAGWDTPIPVDPGAHVVEATAPGYKAWHTQADVSGQGVKASVEVPPLEALPAPPPSPAPGALPSSVSPVLVEAPAPTTGTTQRTVAFVAGGLGVVGAAVGTIFGAAARSDNDTAKTHCPIDTACDAQGLTSTHDAQHAATVSTVAFVAGGALLAAGVVLYLTAPSEKRPTAGRLGLAPVAGAGTCGGAVLQGTW